MSITKIFDRAKKLLDGGDLMTGYEVGARTFYMYYTNKEWIEYKNNMPKEVKNQFDDGKGGEMKEYTRNGITYPPKMASYASSSRFMISQGQAFSGFVYEKQSPTGLGGYPASLDGYLEKKCIYIEAKCHEFYNYSRPNIQEGHKQLLEGIIPLLDGRMAYSVQGEKLHLMWDKKDTGFFDLKQMLCHLSGIANMVLNGGKETVNFIYLVYRPSEELLNFIEKDAYKQRIKDLYKEEETSAKTIDFKAIYGAILHYFNSASNYGYSDEEIINMHSSFNFQFCTQDDFKSVIESLKIL